MLASVVIPTRDVADQLLYTLFSLNLQLTSFEQFEVIIIDNASADETPQKVAQFAANYPLRYVRFKRRLPFYRLVNEGIAQSRGQVIIFLASNCMVPREFIGTHHQAHHHDSQLVLLGLDSKRIYSVYDPLFNEQQHAECSMWLEQYPQIKRPHSPARRLPLLEENQIASGLPFHLGLPCPDAEARLAVCRAYGSKLDGHHAPWMLFQTQHVSLRREGLLRQGPFKALPRVEMEREMARRLLRSGFHFQFANKLTLLKQERVLGNIPFRKASKKNRRTP
ncbi:glycosyltransferase family A protein [Brevibacillus invocatus]|uniref:Glycosyltransferase family 2 protein n=1 Tax=Brevibacillus invocatus TaxID=173959 RepID=A0A3M8CFL5_9BACL|nr:glycosyltransferase family A protein [Brevibacillus invocatus]MCM3080013.1 glycosyltransferase family 2 protein [Brevibacillus invocatus]MCM3430206.1 glycosyltransferase family 2 protein [Brevibacillus invocatus]RNB74283.1 glycosyltransferase family 2 protein [Brevibacillus invocatus]